MRVYKLLSGRHGLKVLRERRLKITEIGELNDPYELLPFDLSDGRYRPVFDAVKNEIAKTRGLVCFSGGWENPVLWSHYGDCHRGMSLGFEIEEAVARPIHYVDKLLPLPPPTKETALALLFTKFAHWRYEGEVRVWASIEERSAGLFFYPFGEGLRLAEVICGGNCSISCMKVARLLLAGFEGVRLKQVRRAHDAFRMIEDETGAVI